MIEAMTPTVPPPQKKTNIKETIMTLNATPKMSAIDNKPGLDDGAYILDSVTVTEKGKVSIYKRDQMKIYSKNRFMFAFYNQLTDRVDAASGMTEWVNGVLVETPTANQDEAIEGLSFDLAISATETGYCQRLEGMRYGERSVDMVEQWITLSTETSEFDGLWKLERSSPEICSRAGLCEMKLIGGEHYIFFQRYSDKGQPVTHFGFGSCQTGASGSLIETGMTSSIEGYAGAEYTLQLELVDNNQLRQVFEQDGTLVTQIYSRI